MGRAPGLCAHNQEKKRVDVRLTFNPGYEQVAPWVKAWYPYDIIINK
jgi:hypothetical protein